MIVRTPLSSVLPDTIALPSPTNRTSLAFFTASEYSVAVVVPLAPVVLSEDTIQPILRISPTVATVLSVKFVFVKSRKLFLAGSLPFTGSAL